MKVEDIRNKIISGKTMLITTYTKAWRVDNKTLQEWDKSGCPLFKDKNSTDTAEGFFMAQGKKFVFVYDNLVKFN